MISLRQSSALSRAVTGVPRGVTNELLLTNRDRPQNGTVMRNEVMPFDVFMKALRAHELDALREKPILVICENAGCGDRVAQAIQERGLQAVCCASLSEARSLLAQQSFSLVFSSDTLLDGDLSSVIGTAGAIPVIVVSLLAEWDAYLGAVHRGACDYIACPPDSSENRGACKVHG